LDVINFLNDMKSCLHTVHTEYHSTIMSVIEVSLHCI